MKKLILAITLLSISLNAEERKKTVEFEGAYYLVSYTFFEGNKTVTNGHRHYQGSVTVFKQTPQGKVQVGDTHIVTVCPEDGCEKPENHVKWAINSAK